MPISWNAGEPRRMKDQTPMPTLKPVVRQTKSEWVIPRIDNAAETERLSERQKELDRLFEGTTPQGREIWRRIMYGIEIQIADRRAPDREIIENLLGYLQEFESFRLEFDVYLSLLLPGRLEDVRTFTPRGAATMAVLWLKLHRECHLAFGGSPEQMITGSNR